MSYRGQDLDLRTPQSWSSIPHEGTTWAPADGIDHTRSRGGITLRGGPIWVDDAVLSICNHAYDLALAHRAAEVRIEHLLHALTRLEAAAEALEAQGIRVASLRRESGIAIASEITAGLAANGAMPRRSDELEEVLRRALAQAERRYAPAGIEDVVGVLFELKADMPGATLLARNSSRPVREAPEPFVAFRRLPPAGASSLSHAANGEGDHAGGIGLQLLDRLQRLETGLEKRLGELARTWSLFADRLNALEHAVLGPRPGEEADLASVHDRIGQLEHSLLTGLTEAGRSWNGVADKLKAMESSLGQRADHAGLAPLVDRLAAIEDASAAQRTQGIEAHASLASELKAVTGALATQSAGAEHVRTAVSDLLPKLEALAAPIEALNAKGGHGLEDLSKHLGTVLIALDGLGEQLQSAQETRVGELAEVHDALMKLNANQLALAGTVDQWKADATDDIGLIGNRIEVLERESVKPLAMLEDLSVAVEAIHKATVARPRRGSGFWRWLFGTDNWVAASWPSQAAASIGKPRSVLKGR